MTEYEKDDRRLQDLLRSATPGFEPGFADRVMDRVEVTAAEGEVSISFTMVQHFRRWAPMAMAAGLALAAFNVSHAAGAAGQSRFDALLGIEPVSVVSAYAITVPGMPAEDDQP